MIVFFFCWDLREFYLWLKLFPAGVLSSVVTLYKLVFFHKPVVTVLSGTVFSLLLVFRWNSFALFSLAVFSLYLSGHQHSRWEYAVIDTAWEFDHRRDLSRRKRDWPQDVRVCASVSRRASGSTSSLLLFVSVDPRVNQSSSQSKTQNRDD